MGIMRAEFQPDPPVIRGRSSPTFFVAVVLALTVVGSGAVLFFFDPSRHGFYPICMFHSLTGWNCPGCGATRAAYELLHGHLVRALRDNALFVLGLAGLAVWTGFRLAGKGRGMGIADLPAGWWWAGLAVVLTFTVLRNFPAFAWLSP